MLTPLGQLVDLLPNWAWYALIVAGLGAPALALAVGRFVFHAPRVGWTEIVIGYYLFALPLAFIVFGGSESAGIVCPFFVFMPVGVMIAIVVLLGASSSRRRFNQEGHPICPTCGYDLRATPDRCPECGTLLKP
jgi:hypothetical protein